MTVENETPKLVSKEEFKCLSQLTNLVYGRSDYDCRDRRAYLRKKKSIKAFTQSGAEKEFQTCLKYSFMTLIHGSLYKYYAFDPVPDDYDPPF